MKGEREGERERYHSYTPRDRETDIHVQTDRESGRQKIRETDSERQRETERQTHDRQKRGT